MFKLFSPFILLLFVCTPVFAQKDTASLPQAHQSHIRISLLTCAPGEEIWESFGHTGVRVVDSSRHFDIIYNYGTFNGYDKDFEINFMRGKLLYWVSVEQYSDFTDEYIRAKRKVQESELLLSDEQKDQVWRFLDSNAQPENRYYKYDFYFDNCATRIRDIFPKVLGKDFQFGKTIAINEKITFRNITDQYLRRRHWERFGINILLGSKIDKVMTNDEIMFLPDFLRDGVSGATVNKQRIATDPVTILPGNELSPPGINQPFFVMLFYLFLSLFTLSFDRFASFGKVITFVTLFISGLLGCFILVMWFGTNHQACGDNYNILWALPTNLFLAFAPKRNKSRYALIGIILLIISLVLHVCNIQRLPMLQLGPFLLALLLVYGTIYRRSRIRA